MSKGEFQFAAAAQISQLLNKFEQDFLKHYTPCSDFSLDQLIEAIAVAVLELKNSCVSMGDGTRQSLVNHRTLVIKAAESGQSLNRLASAQFHFEVYKAMMFS